MDAGTLRWAGFLCWESAACRSASQPHRLRAAAGAGRVGSRVRPTQHITQFQLRCRRTVWRRPMPLPPWLSSGQLKSRMRSRWGTGVQGIAVQPQLVWTAAAAVRTAADFLCKPMSWRRLPPGWQAWQQDMGCPGAAVCSASVLNKVPIAPACAAGGAGGRLQRGG